MIALQAAAQEPIDLYPEPQSVAYEVASTWPDRAARVCFYRDPDRGQLIGCSESPEPTPHPKTGGPWARLVFDVPNTERLEIRAYAVGDDGEQGLSSANRAYIKVLFSPAGKPGLSVE